MAMSLGLVIHISAGAVGLISGAVALSAKKGGANHLLAGKAFFYSMLVMALSGIVLAYFRSVNITMLAGGLTAYLVLSSWLTVQRPTQVTKVLDVGASLLGIAVFTFGAFLCYQAIQGVTDSLGKFTVPAALYFVFTGILTAALLLDLRWHLGKKMSGKQRIIRHLWRMCIPLYVAASSFFNGQSKLFPDALREGIYLSIPENLVFGVMLFWIGYLLMGKQLKVFKM